MAIRDNAPNQAQYEAWLAAVPPAALARWRAMHRQARAGEIRWSEAVGALSKSLQAMYQPTHCDGCGKPIEGSWLTVWDDDRPRAECGPCTDPVSN
jgi:hypothetical protein